LANILRGPRSQSARSHSDSVPASTASSAVVAGHSSASLSVDVCRDRLRMITPAVKLTATVLSLLTKRLQMPQGPKASGPFDVERCGVDAHVHPALRASARGAFGTVQWGARGGSRDHGPRGERGTGVTGGVVSERP